MLRPYKYRVLRSCFGSRKLLQKRSNQFVILNEVKDLVTMSLIHAHSHEILHFFQDDKLAFFRKPNFAVIS